jgi:CSLREA domain-containing protein
MRRLFAGAGLVLTMALIGPMSASAATITPTTTADEYNANPAACSLREAIESANTDSLTNADGCAQGNGPDVIQLQSTVYNLSIPSANGGGALNFEGDLDIINDNLSITAPPQGAIIDGNGTVTLRRVLEVANIAPPITVDITNVSFRDGGPTGDAGGAIAVFGATQAHTLNLTNSSISGSQSTNGGGLIVGTAGTANLVNVTISGNSASFNGGGAYNEGDLNLQSSTVTDNVADSDDNNIGHGGGFYADSAGISIQNTIVAGNRDLHDTPAPDCDGSATVGSSGFSLLGDTTDCPYIALGSGNKSNVDARLAALKDNGGTALTHELLVGSPAINAGSTGGASACPATDARGLARTLGARCDMGAYERVVCLSRAVNRIGTGTADTLVGTGAADTFLLFGGNDIARGGGGGDRFCGGPGKDRLFGQAGRDLLLGQAGRDRLLGGAKRDRLIGGGGRDRLVGGKGNDRCNGGPGLDVTRAC